MAWKVSVFYWINEMISASLNEVPEKLGSQKITTDAYTQYIDYVDTDMEALKLTDKRIRRKQ